MVKNIVRSITVALLTIGYLVNAADYGVGFSLSLDYG